MIEINVVVFVVVVAIRVRLLLLLMLVIVCSILFVTFVAWHSNPTQLISISVQQFFSSFISRFFFSLSTTRLCVCMCICLSMRLYGTPPLSSSSRSISRQTEDETNITFFFKKKSRESFHATLMVLLF